VELTEGDRAPDFALEDADGKTWQLSELRGRRVIVYFYPADDTPGCTAEACDFRDARGSLADAGYVVLGISPQGRDSHRAFSTRYGLNFPLLVDSDRRVASAYGAIKEPKSPGASPGIKRSTFVIDESGAIVQALYGVRAQGHVGALKDSLLAS
jgi:peroxiredoxin Q/BCP